MYPGANNPNVLEAAFESQTLACGDWIVGHAGLVNGLSCTRLRRLLKLKVGWACGPWNSSSIIAEPSLVAELERCEREFESSTRPGVLCWMKSPAAKPFPNAVPCPVTLIRGTLKRPFCGLTLRPAFLSEVGFVHRGGRKGVRLAELPRIQNEVVVAAKAGRMAGRQCRQPCGTCCRRCGRS